MPIRSTWCVLHVFCNNWDQTCCLVLVFVGPVTDFFTSQQEIDAWPAFLPKIEIMKNTSQIRVQPLWPKTIKNMQNNTVTPYTYTMAPTAHETSSIASKKRRLAPLSPCISFTKPDCACCKAPAQSFKLSRSKTLWFDGERRTSCGRWKRPRYNEKCAKPDVYLPRCCFWLLVTLFYWLHFAPIQLLWKYIPL